MAKLQCPHCKNEFDIYVGKDNHQEIARQTEGLRNIMIKLRKENQELKKQLETRSDNQ